MIHLVAEVKAYPDSKDQVVNLLAGLLEPTRQEEDNRRYETGQVMTAGDW